MTKHRIKIFLEKQGASIIIGMLLLFFITDATNAVVRYFEGISEVLFFSEHLQMSGYSRGTVWGLLTGLFFYYNRLQYKTWGIAALLLTMFLVGVNLSDFQHAFTWVIRLAKLSLPFLFWWFFSFVRGKDFLLVIRVFLLLIGVQVLAVIIPFLFGLDLFQSYGEHRFGHSGFIIARNEATLFYLISGTLLLGLWQWSGKWYFLAGFFVNMLGLLLLGTKGGLLILAGFVVYFFYSGLWKRNKVIRIIIVGISMLAVLIPVLTGMVEFFMNLLREEGFLTMLTSYRTHLIVERIPPIIEQWNFFNFLLGGVNPATSFVEMDIIDLFLFGGMLGSAVYYLTLFKTLFAFDKQNSLGWFLVIMYFITGGLAGHFFASGVNALYLVIVCWFLQNGEPFRDSLERNQ